MATSTAPPQYAHAQGTILLMCSIDASMSATTLNRQCVHKLIMLCVEQLSFCHPKLASNCLWCDCVSYLRNRSLVLAMIISKVFTIRESRSYETDVAARLNYCLYCGYFNGLPGVEIFAAILFLQRFLTYESNFRGRRKEMLFHITLFELAYCIIISIQWHMNQ